ncbi:MAG: TraR/DksA C4-type zinc finger protein [Dehalococcoidia bacterium]|nr:MAG: TraR/DksA C4-type zinc finger protein [Dehalococcoidia bacterium]
MTTTNLKIIRHRLEDDRKRLVEQLEQIRANRSTEDRREGSPFGKREEEATETAELENRMALEKRVLDQLAEVDNALTKFDKGTYGICESCGKPINPERLEALPQATLCMSCKAAQAKNAKI